jgi:protein-tyrosine-phosphatase
VSDVKKRVLFVCYGNTCRGPMAAAYANHALPGVRAESAGTFAAGAPANPLAVALMRERFNIDLRGHVSRVLSDLDLNAFDLVVRLTQVEVPTRAPMLSWDIADPVGQGPAAYHAALDAMIKQIDDLPSALP